MQLFPFLPSAYYYNHPPNCYNFPSIPSMFLMWSGGRRLPNETETLKNEICLNTSYDPLLVLHQSNLSNAAISYNKVIMFCKKIYNLPWAFSSVDCHVARSIALYTRRVIVSFYAIGHLDFSSLFQILDRTADGRLRSHPTLPTQGYSIHTSESWTGYKLTWNLLKDRIICPIYLKPTKVLRKIICKPSSIWIGGLAFTLPPPPPKWQQRGCWQVWRTAHHKEEYLQDK